MHFSAFRDPWIIKIGFQFNLNCSDNLHSKQRWFRAEASTRSFAIVISVYSAFVDIIYI